ncbi:Uncharacterized protein TCM_017217 [Theobroma cacao]|uniref:Transmembrane protein n=1 Tax=Theobroma cacao TaxID=3641 RepID=A0A061EKK1_THECC|nr:Uncharacterized protein TCM_017217 [Theobroma cacao]
MFSSTTKRIKFVDPRGVWVCFIDDTGCVGVLFDLVLLSYFFVISSSRGWLQ